MTSVEESVTGNDGAAANGSTKTESQSEVEVPSNLEPRIIRQIEYYFGDSNLPRDKFMLEQIKVADGWIPMSTMLKFQRLTQITSDPQIIAAALKNSDLMEVDSSGDEPKIRRSPEHPLPELNEERRNELSTRTVYCKGFGLDTTLDSVMATLEPYGPIDNIIMRKYKDKVSTKPLYKFKGSVFVTFSSKEKAQEFLDLPSVKFGETELLRMFVNEYAEQKKKERGRDVQSQRASKKSAKPNSEDKKEQLNKALKNGATIKLEGDFDPETSREDIKSALKTLKIEVAFIGFKKGDTTAYVRLYKENSAKAVVETIEGILTVLDVKLRAKALEGEEDDEFLKNQSLEMASFQNRKGNRHNSRRGGKRRGGRDFGPSEKKSRS